MISAENFPATDSTLCDLPQLGGSFFEPAHRPSGPPSLTLRCPIVPTETLNAISKRTRDLVTADNEIRNNAVAASSNACNGAISCACTACSEVRTDLFSALNRVLSLHPAATSEPAPVLPPCTTIALIAPPLPSEPPARPPSTLPHRMLSTTRKPTRPLVIPAPVPEDVLTNFTFAPMSPIAPFRAIDLPLLTPPFD